MVKHQFQRRNLSSIEKIQLAFLSKEAIEKMAKNNLSKAGKGLDVINAVDTNVEIAKIAGVGRTTVIRYSSVLDKGSKAIIDKLNKGKISISSAYDSTKGLISKKDKEVKIKKTVECNFINSIEEGNEKMLAGIIDGYIVINDVSKINLLTDSLKKKIGVIII